MKAQVSLFPLMGLIIIILIGAYLLLGGNMQEDHMFNQLESAHSLSDMRIDYKTYIDGCLKSAAEEAFLDAGIRQETSDIYKDSLVNKFHLCVDDLLTRLESQGYTITKGPLKATVELSDETVDVILEFIITLEKDGQKTKLTDFSYTFDKQTVEKVPEGMAYKDIRLRSANGLSEVFIPAGTRITDEEGNNVEAVSLKVEDVHFKGLSNKVVVGELVYSNLPDGARYSQPVEVSIYFKDEDIPEGYTRDNLKIAYYDEYKGIWLAMDTKIEGNWAKAYTDHNSFRSVVVGRPTTMYGVAPVFNQRYSPCSIYGTPSTIGTGFDGSEDIYERLGEAKSAGTPFWVISGKYSEPKGTATLNGDDNWDKLEDFRDKVEISKTTYGFSETPTTDDTLTFDCEGEGEYNGINYYMDGGEPAFKLQGCIAKVCGSCDTSLIDSECNQDCSGSTYCFTKDEYTCVPIIENSRQIDAGREVKTTSKVLYYSLQESESRIRDLYCGKYPSEDIEYEVEKNRGWFDYKCAAGMVTPNDPFAFDERSVVAYAYFEGEGDATIWEDTISVRTLTNYINFPKGATIGSEIIPFPSIYNGMNKLIGSMVKFTPLSTHAKAEARGETFENIRGARDYNAKVIRYQNAIIPAYGVYGVKVWKTSKADMCANEYLIWEYWGSSSDQGRPRRFGGFQAELE